MNVEVIINDVCLQAFNFAEETFVEEDNSIKRLTIKFHFHVTSESYHEVTMLLYENKFEVKVPHRNLAFSAQIANYSTSITNLYKENAIGKFYLELVERL